jgi:hypothetical protein
MALISTIVNAFLARCQQRNNPEQTREEAQSELRTHYNSTTGKFTRAKVRDVIPQILAAEKKARRENLTTKEQRKANPRMTPAERYAMAEAKLIEAMEAKPKLMNAAYSAAENLGDDD